MNQAPEIKLGPLVYLRGKEAILAVGWAVKLRSICRSIALLIVAFGFAYIAFSTPAASAIRLLSFNSWRSFLCSFCLPFARLPVIGFEVAERRRPTRP